MASTQQIKHRTQSVKNTRQITKAMELVAASKMRKSQELARQSQLYAQTASEILSRLRQMTNVNAHPLFRRKEVSARLIVVMTSARGLAGAYNSNVLRRLGAELESDRKSGIHTKVIAVGKKGANWLAKVRDIEVIGVYDELPENPSGNDIRPMVSMMIDEFLNGRVQAVDILFTHYINSINQVPEIDRLLPAAFDDVEIPASLNDALFEPTPKVVLDRITQRLVEVQLVQTFLEATASEHSMRMVAMKNATDNAGDIIDALTLEFNSARQASITQELAEITAGAEAISA
jgi:F-type H+-transporting ATPase subunit gamma